VSRQVATDFPPQGDDIAVVAAQLGRRPRNVHAVAHRCPCGNPDVIETEPRLADGTPFPTLFYLTCPRLAHAVSGLEASGLMREMTDRLAEDVALARGYRRAHERYLERREALGAVPELAGVSAGGMPSRVKCLHVLVAQALAAGEGVNPLGDETLTRLAPWWEQGRCVVAEGASRPHPLTGEPFVSPVPPGQGWPGDPATRATPVAVDAPSVRSAAETASLPELTASMSVCRACPRLVNWRETVAIEKRRSYEHEPYWGRPIAGWGDTHPAVVIVGLAPAAHGGNRTGRIFTGDRSGDWLFASLHRVGLATLPTSVHAGDGQRLLHTRMVAAVRCAPPGNKPTVAERDTCTPWLQAEIGLVLGSVRCFVALGSYAWDVLLRVLRVLGADVPTPRPRFGHGVSVPVAMPGRPPVPVLGSYHPSQQNTFTGKLTEAMLDDMLLRARRLAAVGTVTSHSADRATAPPDSTPP